MRQAISNIRHEPEIVLTFSRQVYHDRRNNEAKADVLDDLDMFEYPQGDQEGTESGGPFLHPLRGHAFSASHSQLRSQPSSHRAGPALSAMEPSTTVPYWSLRNHYQHLLDEHPARRYVRIAFASAILGFHIAQRGETVSGQFLFLHLGTDIERRLRGIPGTARSRNGPKCKRYTVGMSWRGFERGLEELIHPSYLKGVSSEERRRRTRREWRNSELFFFFQAAEPRPDEEQRKASTSGDDATQVS